MSCLDFEMEGWAFGGSETAKSTSHSDRSNNWVRGDSRGEGTTGVLPEACVFSTPTAKLGGFQHAFSFSHEHCILRFWLPAGSDDPFCGCAEEGPRGHGH